MDSLDLTKISWRPLKLNYSNNSICSHTGTYKSIWFVFADIHCSLNPYYYCLPRKEISLILLQMTKFNIENMLVQFCKVGLIELRESCNHCWAP